MTWLVAMAGDTRCSLLVNRTRIPAEIKIVLKCNNEVRSFKHVIWAAQALIFFLLRINLLLNYFV